MAPLAPPCRNGRAMPYYLCPSCLHVVRAERVAPFDWCQCGQPLDAVSLLSEDVPLAEHASVVRADGARRFVRGGSAPLAETGS
jgi:hypothetical protein